MLKGMYLEWKEEFGRIWKENLRSWSKNWEVEVHYELEVKEIYSQEELVV